MSECQMCPVLEKHFIKFFSNLSEDHRRVKVSYYLDCLTSDRNCDCPTGRLIKHKYEDIRRRNK